MNKKKRLIQLTEGILLCCVIVVMTLLCIGIIKKEVKNTKGKLTETTGWYRIQDNKKVQVDLNQKIKADPQGKLVLYNDTIAQKYKGYLMTTKAAKYSVRIYAGDQLIYRYSDSNFHRNDQMKSKLSCDARIPEQGKKGTVIKIIYQNGSNGIYDLDDILVGRGDVVMGFHVQQEIVGIVMIAIMFFLSFVALITGIYLKHFKLNSTRFLNIAAFLALSGIWFLSDSALAQEYTSFPALTGMISFYAFMLMSVPMVHFVKNTLKFEKYKVLDVINLLFYANALIQGILNKCLKIHMVHMLFVTHVLLFIAVITIVVLMIGEYRRTKDSELKIIMNAFYGVLGTTACRFFDPRLASSITMRGHQIMRQTKALIEAQGYDVIYGDTDSTFVWLKGAHSEEEAAKIGRALVQHVNAWWAETLQKQRLTSALELEYETHFCRFLMPTIRGADTGSKKRYAGLIQEGDKQRMVFKGLETVRTDWTPLAQQFQQELYLRIFRNEPYQEYIRETIDKLMAGELDARLVYRKPLRRPLSEYQRNVPPHVRAARLADEENQKRGRPLQYQNRGTIKYVWTTNGPEPLDYQRSPLDYEHYLTRQLQPVAEGILPFIEDNFATLMTGQLGLF